VVICVIGGDKMLNRKGVSELLKVHINTVDKFVKDGMPSYKIGKKRMFDENEVIDWVKKNGSE